MERHSYRAPLLTNGARPAKKKPPSACTLKREDIRVEIGKLTGSGLKQKEIAQQLGCSVRTVLNWQKRGRNDSSVRDKPRSGRPRKFPARALHDIRSLVKRDKVRGSKDVKRELEGLGYKRVCLRTVQHYVRDAGVKSYAVRRKPLISEKNRKARLAYAKAHRHWTEADWAKVVFTDECKIESRSHHRGRVYELPERGLTRRRQLPTVKHDSVSFMIWACITYDGFGTCAIVKGNMNATQYTIILDNRLAPVMQGHPAGKNAIFQADNDPKHSSKKAKQLLKDYGFKVLDHPSQSPDLNLIEHFFVPQAALRERMTEAPVCTTVKALEQRLDEVATTINTPKTVAKIKSLYKSMPRRMQAVIKAKGYATKY